MVFIPPEVPVDEVLVFVFIVKIGKSYVVAALALLVGPVVFSGVVARISLVWRISRLPGRVWAAGIVDPLVIPERHHHSNVLVFCCPESHPAKRSFQAVLTANFKWSEMA